MSGIQAVPEVPTVGAGDSAEPVWMSVVIPAFNAAETLAETIASLQEQGHATWEAIVVDDGSRDRTAEVAEELAAADPRVRLVRKENSGVSATRNVGLRQARHPWLLFLDADDLLTPDALELFAAEVRRDPGLQLVYGGWCRLLPDGRLFDEVRWVPADDLFRSFSSTCAFAIHACVVRRDLVLDAGGFDETLVTCEDWDLWQRLARGGLRAVEIPRRMAIYRLRPQSASNNGTQMLSDGLVVIDRGHAEDGRVTTPVEAYRAGADARMEPIAKLGMAAYCAGLIVGRGGEPDAVLDLIADLRPVVSDPDTVGSTLAAAIPLGRAQLVPDWPSFEPAVWDGVDAVLARFQEIVGVPFFAQRARKSFERAILAGLPGEAAGLRLGDAQSHVFDVRAPLVDVALEPGVQRVICRVVDGAELLDTLEIPVTGPLAFGWHLADVVAAQLCWNLLGRFLEREVHPGIERVPDGDVVRLRRAGVELGTVDAAQAGDPDARHTAVGWTLMLQEAFGRPRLERSAFYAAGAPVPEDDGAPPLTGAVEIAHPLPEVPAGVAEVEVRCGGALVGTVAFAPGAPRTPHALRSAIVGRLGFELCVVVVREALIGDGDGTLRERLAAAAADAVPAPPAAVRVGAAQGASAGGPRARRAVLPVALAEAVAEVAAGDGRAVQRGDGAVVVVDPGLLAAGAAAAPTRWEHHDAAELDPLFDRAARPWTDDSPYERLRDVHTLALAPLSPARTLELGCDGGRLTALLAQRSGHVDARDASDVALADARARCAGLPNVSLARHATFADGLAGPYDLIVCRDILSLAPTDEGLRHALIEIARTLEPAGALVLVHALIPTDEGSAAGTGADLAHRFGARTVAAELRNGPLRLEVEIDTPAYRVQRWIRATSRLHAVRLRLPRRSRAESLPEEVPPAVTELLRARTGDAATPAVPDPADGVPVLAYHRVAAGGADFTAEWRMHPDRFEAQLAFLRSQGYTGIRTTDLARSLLDRTPLPGRPILLTFDDAYADFPAHAWPLLRKYGFSATIFAVADCTGGHNAWDAHRGERLELLSWAALRRLQAQGAEIGSHTAAHPPLTALAPDAVADDLVRSRAVMARELGAPPVSLAYPFGDHDPVVSRLAGACGFEIAFTCEARLTRIHDSVLAVPRIEVTGRDDVAALAAKLQLGAR